LNPHLTFYYYLVVLLLALPLTLTHANALNTESTEIFLDSTGTSQYTLILSSPDQLITNSNWTITATLNIDRLEKQKTFLFYSRLELIIETSNGKTITKAQSFGYYPLGNLPDRIYAGGYWGPLDFTINLDEEDLGVNAGQTIDATIYAKVDVAEFIDQPLRLEANVLGVNYDTFRATIGTVKITSSDQNPLMTFLPIIIGGATGVVVFTALLIRDRYIGKPE